MNEELEMICFQMITFAGESKSCYMEALMEVKAKNFKKAEELMEQGAENFAQVHKVHSELIQKECGGEKVEMSLLMTHVEDQMMAIETIKIMVQEFTDLYKIVFSLSEDK